MTKRKAWSRAVVTAALATCASAFTMGGTLAILATASKFA
jgi:hypothetical protein